MAGAERSLEDGRDEDDWVLSTLLLSCLAAGVIAAALCGAVGVGPIRPLPSAPPASFALQEQHFLFLPRTCGRQWLRAVADPDGLYLVGFLNLVPLL